MRRPSSGTARWGCSRFRTSRTAPTPSRAPSPTSRGRRSSAAAIRSPRSIRPASPTASRTSRPAAAPHWNFSVGVHCLGSRRWRIVGRDFSRANNYAYTLHCRQLEDVQDRPRDDALRERAAPARQGHQRRHHRHRAPVYRGSRRKRGGAQQQRGGVGAEHVLGTRRGVHRRNQRRHDQGGGRRIRHHRPLRASHAFRRDRRHRQSEGDRGDRGVADTRSSASAKRSSSASATRRWTCSIDRSRADSTA